MGKKPSREAAAREWVELKGQQKAIDQRLADLKEVLEPALREAPDQELELVGFKFKLVESERESFSLSKAREKLDGWLLAPYITKSEVVQIRTTWAGGEEKAA